MDVEDIVRGHYGGAGLEDAVLRGLREAGVDADALTVETLGPLDHLHAGGLPATAYLLEQLDLGPDTRLVDVGCGIGGPSRLAAASYSCPVVGVDLSPDFVDLATMLTERVGLADLVEHRVTKADVIDVADESFDRAMMIHVGMNIPDKRAVFAEVRRLLRTGGTFGLYEQVRTGDGEPSYPLPWADDDRSSFVATQQAYADDLAAVGFAVERVENRVAANTGPGAAPPRLSPAAVFGRGFDERIGNNIAATRAGLLAPVVIIARATS